MENPGTWERSHTGKLYSRIASRNGSLSLSMKTCSADGQDLGSRLGCPSATHSLYWTSSSTEWWSLCRTSGVHHSLARSSWQLLNRASTCLCHQPLNLLLWNDIVKLTSLWRILSIKTWLNWLKSTAINALLYEIRSFEGLFTSNLL